jgi:FKBP-type peptidyl-prolyl cis-trans isomerase
MLLNASPTCVHQLKPVWLPQARQWHTRPAAQATLRPASEQAVTRPASEQAVMRPASKQAESSIARRQTLAAWASSVSILLFPRAAQAEDCKLSSAPSGLQFCDLKVGDGSEAQAGTLIRCAPDHGIKHPAYKLLR